MSSNRAGQALIKPSSSADRDEIDQIMSYVNGHSSSVARRHYEVLQSGEVLQTVDGEVLQIVEQVEPTIAPEATLPTPRPSSSVNYPAPKKRTRAPNLTPASDAWLAAEHDRLSGNTRQVSRTDTEFWGNLHRHAIELKKVDAGFTESGLISAVKRVKAKMARAAEGKEGEDVD
jgi:hypothetical protein